MRQAIEKSRKMQIDKKRLEKELEQKEEEEFAAYWKIRNKELQEAELLEIEEERERNREISNFHKLQAAEKQAKLETDF